MRSILFSCKGSLALSVDDVPVQETWARLQSSKAAVLIDVRTKAEWTFVGLPDLSGLGRQVLTLE
jgi:rhodanese-related sulfurtransferase